MKAVSAKPDYQSLEKEVLELWEKENFFGQLQSQIKGRPLYKFLDGPITANNSMGVHHAWGRTLKDTFIRYKVMTGHDCKFQNGFDCQGLWVEVEVEKGLGFDRKKDIEAYGLDKFAQACKERVDKYAKVITEQSKRLGQWMDWDNSYYTYDDHNIEGIWNFLKVCHQKGWLYKKEMPMPWCPRCGTSLSEHEMAGSYREVTHTAVYAHVPILSEPNRRLLIWTTTPWTLPANTAIAVNSEMEYIEVQAPGWNYSLILGINSKKVLAGTNAKILKKFKGKSLIGLTYQEFCSGFDLKNFKRQVVGWDKVTSEDGSGLVHIAPGCGLEDHALGQENNLEIISPIDETGRFYPNFGFLSGLSTAEASEKVILLLESTEKLFKSEDHLHSYPACWRCKEELVFRLVTEWFIDSKEIKPKMLEAASKVKWQPEFIGKRMEDWLENMGDWCISRKRYWGLPLPFYQCTHCDCLIVIGSKEELRRCAADPSKVDALLELHRPWIDEIKIVCPKCLEPDATRVLEVGDCWLDAGIVPYSTGVFPADWVCEMREQVRLWFYSMLFMGVTLDEESPYKEVLAYERVVAEDGTMFSKTGFMINFDEAVREMGADTMRYLYCRQPVSSDVRFGYEAGLQIQRKMAPLWNIYNFFITYALADSPTLDLDIFDNQILTIHDKWLLARTQEMVNTSKSYYDQYNTSNVIQEVEKYLDEVSNFYVRANRRRFWQPLNENLNDKIACYSVLFHAIKTVAQVMAPITPFTSEHIWQNLVLNYQPWISPVRNFKNSNLPFSIHASEFPEALAISPEEQTVLQSSEIARDIISQGMKLRGYAKVRVRQPLSVIFVVTQDHSNLDLWRETIKSELNIEELAAVESESDYSQEVLRLDFRKAGPLLKQDLNRIKEILDKMPSERMDGIIEQFNEGNETISFSGQDGQRNFVKREAFQKTEILPDTILASESKSNKVALNIRVSDRLAKKGVVRDFIRGIQIIRKEAGMSISDKVKITYRTKNKKLRQVIEDNQKFIAEETLAKKVKPAWWIFKSKVKIVEIDQNDSVEVQVTKV